jgi:hypothetical protein
MYTLGSHKSVSWLHTPLAVSQTILQFSHRDCVAEIFYDDKEQFIPNEGEGKKADAVIL